MDNLKKYILYNTTLKFKKQHLKKKNFLEKRHLKKV